jgi:hypothetical protein
MIIKDGYGQEKERKTDGLGTIASPIVPYNKIDGNLPDTVTGDLAAMRVAIEDLAYGNGYHGTSIGTGAEQAIAHGVIILPVGAMAWITYLIDDRYFTTMIPFDATYVYPTVDTGTSYQWRIG